MSEKSTVELIEDWQTGAFFVIGSILIGVIVAVIGGSVGGLIGAVAGFLGGTGLAFLALSYLLYGR